MDQRPLQGSGHASVNDDERAHAIRRAAERQWSRDPAGAIAVGQDSLDAPESFARIERHRYIEQPWMHDTFGYDGFKGQRLLEIGVGLGTDHLQFARAGARMTGIDLTPRCIELTRQRFEHERLTSDLRVMDAEHLEFPDDSFDVVYSFGVLHHVPSTERAFTEVRRVLRPGGRFIGAVYNRWSLFIGAVMLTRIVNREWRHESFQRRLSRIEHSTADESPGPYVRLFSRRQLRRALRDAGFRDIELIQRHFGLAPNRQLPEWIVQGAGRVAGWYLVHSAS
jgi:ubiquinone/menaquinone biosynthesis C-methylase UbiE